MSVIQMKSKEKLAEEITKKIASLEARSYNTYEKDTVARIEISISNLYIALTNLYTN